VSELRAGKAATSRRTPNVILIVLILALVPCPVASALQSKGPATQRITRPTSEPYTGDLSIFEDSGRAEKLQINRVMDILQIKQGSNVADIGAGSGWFTTRAARRAGATGKVFAVEINPEFLKYIRERAVDEKLTNIQTVLGKEDDPLLPPSSVDAVLILKTYHEVAQPILLLARLRRSNETECADGNHRSQRERQRSWNQPKGRNQRSRGSRL